MTTVIIITTTITTNITVNNSVISLILYLSQKSIVMCSFETLFFYLIDYQ